MKILMKASVVVGTAALLSACAGNYNIEKVSMMSDSGGAFAAALHKHYVEHAQFEKGEGDWASVGFFNSRGEMAAMGKAPMAQMPSERKLKVDAAAIGQASTTLMAALKTNAPQMAPDACARAQTSFEHWMEQAEEGHQPTHIANERSAFEKAMPECKGEMVMPAIPDPFVVYFTHNSAELTSAANAIIERSAKAAMAAKVKRAVLIGHTDRSGSSDYNMALSQKRAEAVAAALMSYGLPKAEVQSSHAGETSPQVATDDGMRERMNRRVEVVFER